jgi:hypothetical protein
MYVIMILDAIIMLNNLILKFIVVCFLLPAFHEHTHIYIYIRVYVMVFLSKQVLCMYRYVVMVNVCMYVVSVK